MVKIYMLIQYNRTRKLILNFEKIKKKVTNDDFTVLAVTHDWIDEL